MAIRIGHASLGSNGKVSGDAPGDQNSKEVCARSWYDRNWKVLIRAKDQSIAERMAVACEKGCANNHIGYSQAKRNTAHTQAQRVGYDLSRITVDCDTDCSAYMTLCAIAGGVSQLEYSGNAPTTRTMAAAFGKTGKFLEYTDSKYLTGTDYLKRGDILVAPGSHTVMVLDNGAKAAEDIEAVARDVLAGRYGNGEIRKANLIAAGYNPAAVQAIVNRLLSNGT